MTMQWTETIEIDAPIDRVFDAMLDQDHVMSWSAWPEATGFSCAVEGDGSSVGSEIVFRNDEGEVQGRQRIVSIDERRISNRLENKGPLGRTVTPRVDFVVEPLGAGRTKAHLDFEGDIPLPFGARHLVESIMGRWVRRLHVKDLDMLKDYVESGRSDDPSG